MKIEGRRYRLWLAPDISAEEWLEMGSTLCRILIAGAPEPRGHRRAVAVRAAMHLYEGSPSRRAKRLEASYRSYLASAWPREKALDVLPEPRSTKRILMHRLAKLTAGRSLAWRTIYDIYKRDRQAL